jgi:hypothetical protein
MSPQRILDGCSGDLETQLEQFAFDLAVTPAGVLLSQAKDQAFKFFGDGRPSPFVITVESPLEANEFLVPAKNRPGLKDADDRTQLCCGSICDPLQSGRKNAQDHLISAIGVDRFVVFALKDVQLLA